MRPIEFRKITYRKPKVDDAVTVQVSDSGKFVAFDKLDKHDCLELAEWLVAAAKEMME